MCDRGAYHLTNRAIMQAVSSGILRQRVFPILAIVLISGVFFSNSVLAKFPDSKPTPARPNILFVYTDDQSTWSIGAYGNPNTLTPNLDRFASQGMLFQNAFTTTPVCSPSRAGLLTSLYSTQIGISDWLNPTTEPHQGLSPALLTWPELLKANGYKTFLAGKWHLGLDEQFHPSRSGFDEFFGFLGGGNTPINPTLEENGATGKKSGVLADLLTDKTLEFIRANKDRTWLAALHFREPHAPYVPTSIEDTKALADLRLELPVVEGLQSDRVMKLRREYLTAVHAVDRNFGKLMTLIDDLKLTENTLVIFTSDHGYMIGEHGLIHKGNASYILKDKTTLRPNMFDNAIRVPLMIRQPGRIAPGMKAKHTMTQLDLFPTILRWVGLGTPQNLKIQGRDASALLGGNTVSDWDDSMFGQYDMKHPEGALMRMLRTNRWKLIRHFQEGLSDELYDLETDPDENRNLIGQESIAPVYRNLKNQLLERMKSISDPLAKLAIEQP